MRDLKSQLVSYIAQNRGWHSKSELLEMVWIKNHYKNTRYSPDTVGRKLRLATEEHLLQQYVNSQGHAQYKIASGKEEEKPKKIIRVETVFRDGIPYARPIYG